MDHILTCGTGRGRMFFWDLRAQEYLPVWPEALSPAQTPVPCPTSFSNTDPWHDDSEADYSDTDEEEEPYDYMDMLATTGTLPPWARSPQPFQPYDVPPYVVPMPWSEPPGNEVARRCRYLQTGMGWLDHDHVYM